MKEGWKYARLLDKCNVYQPQTISTKQLIEDGEYDVFGANGWIGKYNQYNHEQSEVLLTCRGATCGNINVSTPKAWINGNAMVVHPKDNDILKDFLVYLLKSIDFSQVITGAAQPQITRTSLSSIRIPILNLSDQQRIVTYLDAEFAKIAALKANAEKQLQAAKDLFQAALKELLTPKEGWVEKKLGELCSICGEYGLNESATDYNGVRYLRITDITDDGELNNDKVSAQNKGKKNQEELEVGDILFARTGATVGKTLVYRKEFGKCVFAGYLIRYRTNPNIILPQYLFYYTHSTKYYDWVRNNQAAAAQPNISAQKYNCLIIAFPKDTAAQQRIAARLDALSANVKALQTNYTETITLCNDLKQALLKKVFE